MSMKPTKERAKLERLAWKHTHKDFRGKTADGQKTITKYIPTKGTCVVLFSSLTDEELLQKIPTKVRQEEGL